MDFDYNRIFLENRHLTNRSASIWMSIIAGACGLIWILSLAGILNTHSAFFNIAAPICVILLLLPMLVSAIFNLRTTNAIGTKYVDWLSYLIVFNLLVVSFLLSASFPVYGLLVWFFPLVIACQYYSKRYTLGTFMLGLVGLLASLAVSITLGTWNTFITMKENEMSISTFSHLIFYVMPCILLYCASFPLVYTITRRTELLLKKQKLSIMAVQAKQNLHSLQEFPDTYVTDCKIKMRYLVKNNIDVDAALKNMDDNVDKYNDFVLTFVGESNRKEDELYSLLDADTLLQYGAKVHALRIKANALGLKNLTDTAFFHEMEAYAGNIEIVAANWEKLSFEWDEAIDLFTHYINSLGLRNHASDGKGNSISFQQWGAQLNEAFVALEAFDTIRARSILNGLLQYQIDADINKNIETIIANIDDILKA